MADDDLHELSALYVLDVLHGDDRERFEAHLEHCEDCRGSLDELRGAAGALAFAEAGPEPPAALRGRILAAAAAERPNVVPLRARRSIAVSVAAAVAVAATAAAVAFGVWAATLHHSLSNERAATRVLANPLARHVPIPGRRGELVVAPSGRAVLTVDLPKPPDGLTYEAWVADPAVRRAGTFSGQTTTLSTRVPRGARVMVTLEHSGGVDAPTQQPLLVVRS
ncbi:MAG: anti-sigma factor domain-containing protein [Gaiellaceae bacterium]